MRQTRKLVGVGIGWVSARWVIVAVSLLAVMVAGYAVSVHRAKAAATGDDELAGSSITQEEVNWTICWETYDEPSGDRNEAIDDDEHPATPNTGEGNGNKAQRIFPDKKVYNDQNAASRWKVFAVAEFTEKPPAGTKVWFRLWDVDDPSDADGPIDADTCGPDNRDETWAIAGGDGKKMVAVEVGTIQRFPGDAGTTVCDSKHCKVAVKVGMQPGDNFRFAATTPESNKPALENMTQAQADTAQPPGGVKISKVLTVWRKVHIEVDSMQPDTQNTNMLTDTIDAAAYNAGTNQTDLEVDDVPGMWSDWDVDDSFNNGYIKVQNEPTSPWLVVDFDANLNDDDVFVAGNQVSANGKTYWLGDDDYANVGGNLVLKIAYPRDPNTAWLESRLAKAYVKPEFDRDTDDAQLTFARNQNTVEFLGYISTNFDYAGRGCKAFWVARLASAHQPGTDVDNDPDTENTLCGRTLGNSSVVYLETTRDEFQEDGFNVGSDERAIVVHEIGHTLGANDIQDGGSGAGVMYYNLPLPDTWFVEQSILEIRSKTHD